MQYKFESVISLFDFMLRSICNAHQSELIAGHASEIAGINPIIEIRKV
jgi:hypothetical protein